MGHMLAAISCGIKVEAFSIGWGKVIFSREYKNIEFRISLLPIGGYCKMKGETENNTDNDSFRGVHPLKRIITSFAGPFFNLVFTILISSLLFLFPFKYSDYNSRIIVKKESGWPAYEAGLRDGDLIKKINTDDILSFQDLRMKIGLNSQKNLLFTIERDKKLLSIPVIPHESDNDGIGKIGIYPWVDPIINEKDELFLINSIDNLSINNTWELFNYISESGNDENKNYELFLTDSNKQTLSKKVTIADISQFNFKIPEFTRPSYTLVKSFTSGLKKSAGYLNQTWKGLTMMLNGKASSDNISGPLRITFIAGAVTTQAYSDGFASALHTMLDFMALLSMALFFMNLLPIPVLDGGQIVLHFLELIFRRPVNEKISYLINISGIILIFMILIYTTTNDFLFLAGK